MIRIFHLIFFSSIVGAALLVGGVFLVIGKGFPWREYGLAIPFTYAAMWLSLAAGRLIDKLTG